MSAIYEVRTVAKYAGVYTANIHDDLATFSGGGIFNHETAAYEFNMTRSSDGEVASLEMARTASWKGKVAAMVLAGCVAIDYGGIPL